MVPLWVCPCVFLLLLLARSTTRCCGSQVSPSLSRQLSSVDTASSNAVWNASETKVTGNVIWKGPGVILVTGDNKLEITAGSSLTISPGTRIRFDTFESGILNNGLLHILGQKANTDEVENIDHEASWVVMEPSKEGKQWSGIVFGPTAVTGTVLASLNTTRIARDNNDGGIRSSIIQRTRISGVFGGRIGALRCPYGHAPYMDHVTISRVRGRAIYVANLQERLILRHVTIHRRKGASHQRSDVRIWGGRFRQRAAFVNYARWTGSVWIDRLRVRGGVNSDAKKNAPFVLSVWGLREGMVLRNSHLEGSGGVEAFECIDGVQIQRNNLTSYGVNNSIHLSLTRVGKAFSTSRNLVVGNLLRTTRPLSKSDGGARIVLSNAYAFRMEQNEIHQGGPVSIDNFRTARIVMRKNRWIQSRVGDSTDPLFRLGTAGFLLFSRNDMEDCQANKSDLFVLASGSQVAFRENMVRNCVSQTGVLLRIQNSRWKVHRNIFDNVTTPFSVDVSAFFKKSDLPQIYNGTANNYWGSTFQEDIVSGRRRTVVDALTSTSSLGAVVNFISVLVEPFQTAVISVDLPMDGLIRADGQTLGGIVRDGVHVLDVNALSQGGTKNILVGLNLIIGGSAQLHIHGGGKDETCFLPFQRNVGIFIVEDGKLTMEGKNGNSESYLHLVAWEGNHTANVNGEDDSQVVKWGRIVLGTSTDVVISNIHMRDFGGIYHEGSGSLRIESSWVEGSPPPEGRRDTGVECLYSIGSSDEESIVEIFDSSFENCYDGFTFLRRQDVVIVDSTFESFGWSIAFTIDSIERKFVLKNSKVYHSYDAEFTDDAAIIEMGYDSELAQELTIKNSVLRSNSSTGIVISTCFSSIYLENNIISFQNNAINYAWLAEDCPTDTFSIRNNTLVDSVTSGSGIFITYDPKEKKNDNSNEQRGRGLVIAGNSFRNVTLSYMIRAEVENSRGRSVQITENIVNSDAVATLAFIRLAPWNCPGATSIPGDPSLICSVEGNTFMDRSATTPDSLVVDFGGSLDFSRIVVDASKTYWGTTEENSIRDGIKVFEGFRDTLVGDPTRFVRYLPYRLGPEKDAMLFPSCANTNLCNDNGICVDETTCKCFEGWEGQFCDEVVDQ